MLTSRPEFSVLNRSFLSLFLFSLLVNLIFVTNVSADEEFDFEQEFSIQRKSTLETFPLQEIDQESLSDLAIEGALQVQNQSSNDGKPVHQKVKEAGDKKQSEEALSEAEKDPAKEDEILKFSQIVPDQPQIQPIIYSQPTGRTYTEHQTTTTFRP